MDIKFEETEILNGLLPIFNLISPGSFEVFIALCAFAPEKTKEAKVTVKDLALVTGFSTSKISTILRGLKREKFIISPLEGQQGKVQIYKLKALST